MSLSCLHRATSGGLSLPEDPGSDSRPDAAARHAPDQPMSSLAAPPGLFGPERVWDVHAHYLPPAALDLMHSGRGVVTLDTWCGVEGNIHLNGMPVGSTLDRLASVDSILSSMDAQGVAGRVLSPPPFTYRYWNDPGASTALCQLLNEATAAVVHRRPDRFLGLATVPLQDPDRAVEELRRAVLDLGLHGVTLGTNVDGRHVADPQFAPVLHTAADLDVPVLIHPDFTPNPRWSDHYLINLVGLPTETALCIAELVFTGRLAELDTLRLCFVHGGGALPFLLGRLRKGWEVRPEVRQATSDPPLSYLGNVFFDSLTHDLQALRFLIDVVGVEHVVVGSDAPFDVEDPGVADTIRRCELLTTAERDQLLHRSILGWLDATSQEEQRA